MKHTCDHCGKPATVHLTEINGGQKIEKHLCEHCAASEGITVKADVPISQLLENFVLQGSPVSAPEQEACDLCGIRFSEFRKQGLLGCPHDYDVFGALLEPLLERSHEGASQHIGKVPRQAGKDQMRTNAILRLRNELKAAIAREDYEQAVEIRDQIKEWENA